MIQLFNGLQSSLSMVYDREVGAMRILLVSPYPRWFLLVSKLTAGICVSILQVYAFLLVAYFWGVDLPEFGFLTVLPALVLSGFMLGAMGLLMSSIFKQMENFASVMNFVIFPMFFASSALYPLWRVQESSLVLYYICMFNPFSYAVELVRFALYGQFEPFSALVVALCSAFFLAASILAYDPSAGIMARRGGPDAAK
jgi:ABC-2 type transport system permease protein